MLAVLFSSRCLCRSIVFPRKEKILPGKFWSALVLIVLVLILIVLTVLVFALVVLILVAVLIVIHSVFLQK